MNWKGLVVVAAIVAVATGCAEKRESAADGKSVTSQQAVTNEPASSNPATHAPAGVVPGSYEDWCGEHGVPESACTRCNPDLIPAFQATGDWCAEHGLPESQCLKCNPDLVITRPPKT